MLDMYDIWLYPLQVWWRTVNEISNFLHTGEIENFIFRHVMQISGVHPMSVQATFKYIICSTPKKENSQNKQLLETRDAPMRAALTCNVSLSTPYSQYSFPKCQFHRCAIPANTQCHRCTNYIYTNSQQKINDIKV